MEWLHHRHMVAAAREDIRREIEANQKLLPENLAHLRQDTDRMKNNIVVIRQLRDHPRSPHGKLVYEVGWSSFTGSAFKTARDTGALAYMPFDELQGLSQVYSQQDYLNGLGTTLFTDQGKAPAVLAAEVNVEDLQLDQLALLMNKTTDILFQLENLDNLLGTMQQEYQYAEKLEKR